MSDQRLTTEYSARVYDDDHGYYVEVGKDRDGMDLCEITYSDGDTDAKPITIPVSWEHAERVADAIKTLANARRKDTPDEQ